MDRIKIEILPDGQISIETDSISQKNHVSADEFLSAIEKLVGQKTGDRHKEGHTQHTHQDGITHSH